MLFFYISVVHLITLLFLIKVMFIINKTDFSPAFSGITFGFLVYYFLVPVIIFAQHIDYKLLYPSLNEFIFNFSFSQFMFTYFIILSFYLLFLLIYIFSKKNKIVLKKNNLLTSIYNEDKLYKIINIIAFTTFIVGGISFTIFLIGLGGIGNALQIAELNRSFSRSLSEFMNYRLSLLILPSKLITVSPLLFFMLISKYKGNHKVNIILFIISLFLSSIFFLFNAGRAPLIIFLLCFLYLFLKNIKVRYAWTLLIVLGSFSLPILDLLENIFNYLNNNIWEEININYLDYIYQFLHPYRNVLNMSEMHSHFGFRYGKDFITAFINFIPGINYSVSYENPSYFFHGELWKILGGIPNDIITFSYMQFGYFGVIFFPVIIGYFIARIDSVFIQIIESKSKYLLSAMISTSFYLLVASADFEPQLKGNIVLITIFILITFTYKTEKNGV